MIESILVATDGSRHAGDAVELASFLAAKCGAELTVIHVYPRGVSEGLMRMAEAEHLVEPAAATSSAAPAAITAVVGTSVIRRHPDLSPDVLEALGRQILAAAKDAAKSRGVKVVHSLAEDGDPAQRILDCAQRTRADLIVMGRRGLSDLQGLFMGSVSHKVSHMAECACLTVK